MLVSQTKMPGDKRITEERCSGSSTELAFPSDSVEGRFSSQRRPSENKHEKAALPDGGWGWIIVIVAFFVHILVGQSLSMFSVLYINLIETLDGETGDIGWVGSLYRFSLHIIGEALFTSL